MTAILGTYLAQAALAPWQWGEHDCCTFIANWTLQNGWPDPMAFIRGAYSTETGALRHIERGGGLVALVRRGMADAGVPELGSDTAPEQGDAGVIERDTADGMDRACAIYTGERWISLGLRGIVSGPADVIAVWRPTHG